ncbi:MAG: hypothetical protein RLZZ21_2142 [Planctomycetota bacterium]|jgi:hypothetical protein
MPRFARLLVCLITAAVALPAAPAFAISPQNPYRSFNLSGINYGSMQWERAQRQGKRVWPYYNTPSRSYSRGGVVTGGFVGGGGGAIIQGSGYRSSPRVYRRSRR